MDEDETIDKFTSQSIYDYDGNEKTPLYSKDDDQKAVLKLIVGFCMVFCIGILIILLIHIHYGSHQLVPHGNVASDSPQCSQYGIDVLKMGGNAVDAAITTALCSSIALLHLSGLGGSGVMVIYDHRTGVGHTIDFRSQYSSNFTIGVPGFLAGLFYTHLKYGILPWKTLVEPSINLAKSGITVTESLLDAINDKTMKLVQDENLKRWLDTVTTVPVNHKVKAPKGLINTLNLISSQGPNEFYKEMSQELMSILKPDDIIDYKPIFLPALRHNFMNYTIITSNNGTGGPILIKLLTNFNNTYDKNIFLLNTFQDLYNKWDDNSGLQVSTTDVFDLYVTITSGLGSVFGSCVLTNSGYILNNHVELSHKHEEMDETKRIPSLHLPLIAVETEKICGRRLVSGSADVRDGAQILLSMLKTDPQKIMSVNTVPRFHFKNNLIEIENHFPKQIEEIFINLGYNISDASLPYPTSNIVQKLEDKSIAFSDSRGSGQSFTI